MWHLFSPVSVRFFFDVQRVSGVLSNSVTATLYKSVTAKHLKAGSLYSPLLWLKKIQREQKKFSDSRMSHLAVIRNEYLVV